VLVGIAISLMICYLLYYLFVTGTINRLIH
jgi:hypothetical protein